MTQQDTFVIAAQVAAKLHFATQVAKDLSLTAKNAHAISARAGQQSAGFRAITSFIEELSDNTISYAQRINYEAIKLAALASDRQRAARALAQFERVQMIAADAAHISTITQATADTATHLQLIDSQFIESLKKLFSQLRDAQQQIRAAAIIASTSKIEATLAGSFQARLEVIAENITQSSDQIRQYLSAAEQLLADSNEIDKIYTRTNP